MDLGVAGANAFAAAIRDTGGARHMATTPRSSTRPAIEYRTGDGKPMAETDLHRQIMVEVIETLEDLFASDPMVYVSGNLLDFYEEGNRRKHVAPDVFVVRGIPKHPARDHYLMWEEGRGPNLVIEVTSKTTQRVDRTKKLKIYRDVIKVPEYFQFDPTEDYLKPSLQGHRLVDGEYAPIVPVNGRLLCEFLGLEFERVGQTLRLRDPATGHLRTRLERLTSAEQRADRAEVEVNRLHRVEADIERLHREMEELRRQLSNLGLRHHVTRFPPASPPLSPARPR
jgi:Uma2 family endonuclease